MSNAKKAKKAETRLLSKGSYAIYEAPNGDGVIAYRPEGEEADSHQVVPAKFWSLAMSMLRGEMKDINPMALMKMMMGGK
jgi:hypothetical protein